VSAGYECGLSLEGFQDLKQGDVIESYEKTPVIRRINPNPSVREAQRLGGV
jgi:translation initiation factor IF-2